MMEIVLFGGPDDGAVTNVPNGTKWLSAEVPAGKFTPHAIYVWNNHCDNKGRIIFEHRQHL